MQVNVSIASGEGFCIKIVLRCLATPGDGLGHCEGNDGGILSGIMAAGFKGKKYYATLSTVSYFSVTNWRSSVNMGFVLVAFEMMKSEM